MKPQQLQQLKDLQKCWIPQLWTRRLIEWMVNHPDDDKLANKTRQQVRSLHHQYRHQIRAIRRNQAA